jgi:hypothetical protein
MPAFCVRSFTFLGFIAVSAISVLMLPDLAEAQLVRVGGGAGVNVNALGVNVNVPPINALAARGAGGRRFFGRRRALQQQQAEQRANQQQTPGQQQNQPLPGQQPGNQVPELAPQRASVAVAGAPAMAAPSTAPLAADAIKAKTLPTPELLATMDVSQLENTLRDVSSQLHVRLSNLKTGAGWQRYLKIPGVLLDAPTQNAETLQKTLAKYDAIAGNPRYAKLAGLPTFIATGATLRELSAISGNPQLNISGVTNEGAAQRQAVVTDEILPTPAEPRQPDATRGERSILKRASR